MGEEVSDYIGRLVPAHQARVFHRVVMVVGRSAGSACTVSRF